MGFWFLSSSSSEPPEKFRASRRSCEIERAENANFATAGNTGKKKDRREKAQKLRHGRSRLHGYFGFINGERSFSLQDVLSASFLLSHSRRSATASETAQREHRRSRLNGFLVSPGLPIPRLPHSSLLLFYSSSSVFLSSSLQSLDAQIYSAVTSRSARNEFVFESASLFNFIISVALISRSYLHLAATLCSVISIEHLYTFL